MATNSMTPSLYAAPVGIATLDEEEGAEPLQIDIVDPESVTLSDGSMEITLVPDAEIEGGEFDENLAEKMDDGQLNSLASELMGLIDADVTARKDWADMYVKGLEVLGFKYEERTDPWEDACGVYSTLLSEAVIRFQAETMSETFPAAGPVKTKIIGAIDRMKEQSANRIVTGKLGDLS